MTHPVDKALNDVIVNAIVNQPRSQQKLIGPSEIGIDCIRCLARKLAGVEKLPASGIHDLPWLPFVGTAVHAMLEDIFANDNESSESHRWLIEEKLTIGTIGDKLITGSCDLFDRETNTVIDHKIVGETKLREVPRKGPGNTYRIQAHLYGYGWRQLGFNVHEVAVKFYPRNNISLGAGVFWHEMYDEQIALDALARANEIYAKVSATDNLNEYLKTLDIASGCFSCSEYPSLEEPVIAFIDDLFTQPTPFNKR